MLPLALSTLILTADAGATLTSLEFTQKLKSFAKDGGAFVSTGIIYSNWGAKGRSSGGFKAAAMKLLKRP